MEHAFSVVAASGLLTGNQLVKLRSICSGLKSMLSAAYCWPLEVSFTTVRDENLQQIIALPIHERRLSLSVSGITDAGVAHLSSLPLHTLI